MLLPPSGDLFADPAYELTRHISRAAQDDGIKVLLAGQGGDELFGGYRRHAVASALEKVRLDPAVDRSVIEGWEAGRLPWSHAWVLVVPGPVDRLSALTVRSQNVPPSAQGRRAR